MRWTYTFNTYSYHTWLSLTGRYVPFTIEVHTRQYSKIYHGRKRLKKIGYLWERHNWGKRSDHDHLHYWHNDLERGGKIIPTLRKLKARRNINMYWGLKRLRKNWGYRR